VISAVAAGLLANHFLGRRVIFGLFVAAVAGYAVLSLTGPSPGATNVLYANIFLTFIAVFGLRGVYFAMLEETRVPSARTGTAVGLISVAGYTPDFLFAPIAGRLLDASPGLLGHQHVFMLLGCVAGCGVLAVVLLGRVMPAPGRERVFEDG
jgi:nitrate/nitrite transporter NarK